MGTRVLVSGLLVGLFSLTAVAGPVERLDSPGGVNRVEVTAEGGSPRYRVLHRGTEILKWSPLGFVLKGAPDLAGPFRIASAKHGRFDETWEQPWGEERRIRDHYRELLVELRETGPEGRRLDVRFRAFDDGVAFRYEYPGSPDGSSTTILRELTGFHFVGDPEAWWIPAFQPHRYEYLYRRTPLSAMPAAHTPATIETGSHYVALHEADLTDFASMTLVGGPDGRVSVQLVPWKDGAAVKTAGPFRSSWRTIQIGDNPGELVTSYLSLNLNEPNRLGDVSWVRPRKYLGIWWEMHLGTHTWGSGPRHGATTERAKSRIDAAAEYGIPGLLIEGWNVGWDGNWMENGDKFSFTQPYPDFDLFGVARHARGKGVHLIGHHETAGGISNYERQAEAGFQLYRSLGIDTVKTGYVGSRVEGGEWHHGQFMVRHHQKITELAAKHRISLVIHEPIKDTGLRRTYPNLLSREGARGIEYDAWSNDGGNPPDHGTILPFTRCLSGPFDFTPGIFDLLTSAKPGTRSWTTLAKQLAFYVVIYSPVQMASDLPENYRGHPAFKFIQDVPVDWETTRVLHAKIGDYVTMVRKDRHSDDWYLGSLTDENGRTLTANLSFLDPKRRYQAEIYRDTPDSHYRTNPLPIRIESRVVSAADTLSLELAPGGGTAVRFTPLP